MIKKIILLIFFIVAQTFFSQKYEFNYMLTSERAVENPNYYPFRYTMLNSENHFIKMHVGKDVKNGVFSSVLMDEKYKIGHNFTLGKVMEAPLVFNYTDNFKFSEFVIYPYKKLKIRRIGNLHYKINVASKDFEIELKLEPYEADLILIHFESLNFEQSAEIENLIKNTLIANKEAGNFYIKEITYKYKWNNEYTKFSEKFSAEKIDVQVDL